MTATHSPTAHRTVGRGLNITLWTLQILGVVFFALAGLPKLLATADSVAMYDKIGFGDWFMYLTGAVELAGAVGLLVPRLCGLAAAGLTVVMLCATIANLTALEMAAGAPITVLLALVLGFVAWGRRDRIRLRPNPSRN